MNRIEVLPSVLSADFSRLTEEIRSVEDAGAKTLHLDVMDGSFVPNLTFGPIIIRAIRKLTGAILDTHLMVDEPGHLVPAFRKAGADWISIHLEACGDVAGTLQEIRDSGALPGLVLNPETPFEEAVPYLNRLNHLLIMTVHPGFGGQSFISEVLPKIEEAKRHRGDLNLDYRIQVDGGVNREMAHLVRDAGADMLIAGSALFGAADRAAEMRAIAGEER